MWAGLARVGVIFSLIYNDFEKLSLFDNNFGGKGTKVGSKAKEPPPHG
jgi:hypothetical protein